MTNGKCSTGQVVLWLEKHPTHTAEAPKTDGMVATRAHAAGWVPAVVFEFLRNYRWLPDSKPYQRSDWTIYNEHGEPVEFKRKRKPTRVGSLLITKHGGVRIVLGESIAPGEYDLFTRERRS